MIFRLLEERKKKKKKTNEGEINFPGREEIKFGDVVKAPPKLVNVPKVRFSNKSVIFEGKSDY